MSGSRGKLIALTLQSGHQNVTTVQRGCMPSSQLGSIQINSSLTRLEMEVENKNKKTICFIVIYFQWTFFKALSTQDAVRKHLKSPEQGRPRLQNMTLTLKNRPACVKSEST